MLISLVLRIDKATLGQERVGQTFYQSALIALLLLTMVPIVLVITFPSAAERAQIAITKLSHTGKAQLEHPATTPQAVQRVRAAVVKLTAVRTLGRPPPALPLSARAVFEQIDRDVDGRITARELLTWWTSHESAALDSSRLPTMQAQLGDANVEPDDMMDYTDYEYVLEKMREAEYTEHEDATGRKYVVHTASRTSAWALPTVNVWLHDLFTSTPPGLLRNVVAIRNATLNPLSTDCAQPPTRH